MDVLALRRLSIPLMKGRPYHGWKMNTWLRLKSSIVVVMTCGGSESTSSGMTVSWGEPQPDR